MLTRHSAFRKTLLRHLFVAVMIVTFAFAFAAHGFADQMSEYAKNDFFRPLCSSKSDAAHSGKEVGRRGDIHPKDEAFSHKQRINHK